MLHSAKIYTILLLVCSLVAISAISSVSAQTLQPYTIEDAQSAMTITLNPKYPRPEEKFTVSLESYAFDLNSSDVTFSREGVVLKKEKGLKSFMFEGVSAGDSALITVAITTLQGLPIKREFRVQPGTVSLLWNAETYTPPFYKGKALYTEESSLYAYATPDLYNSNGRKLPNSEIIYTWSINDRVQGDKSGLGKSTFLFDKNVLSDTVRISVQAESLDRQTVAKTTSTVSTNPVVVSVYRNDPLYGIQWNSSSQNLLMTNNQISLFAVPYYFSTRLAQSSSLVYQWRSGGQAIADSNTNSINLAGNNEDDIYSVQVSVENINTVFQKALRNLSIF